MNGDKLRNWMLRMSAALDQVDAAWDGLEAVVLDYTDPTIMFMFMQTIGQQKTFTKTIRVALSKNHKDCDCDSCRIGKEVFGAKKESEV